MGGLFFFIFGLLYLAAALTVGPNGAHKLGRFACRGTLWCAGLRLRQVGCFPAITDGPYLYLFNHSSLLDTFVVIALIPEFTTAVGKKEQFKMPFWGWILRRWGAVPIDRGNLDSAIQSLNAVEISVKSGRSLLLAPEGTRSLDGCLGPFKKGPFHIAKRTMTPIIPMAISGAFEAKKKGSWLLSPGIIHVNVGSPVRFSEDISVDTLRQQTRQIFEAAMSGDSA